MNILVIHEVDYLKKVVYDYHMLSEAMSLREHNVYVIDYENKWNGIKSPKEQIVSRVFPDSKVHLIRPNFIRVPILSRISAFYTHYFEIKRIIKEKNIDVIILYSVPTNGMQTIHWAKHYGIPVIFRSLDVLNKLVVYPPLRPFTSYLEKKVYPQCDMILTITPKLSDYVVKCGAKMAEVLPMPVDTKEFYPFKSSLREKWGIKESDKVILFMGTLFDFCGLDWFLCGFDYVLDKIPNAKLLVVGEGEFRIDLERLSKQYGDSVIYTGVQPYEDMPQYINMADVCLLPFIINGITRDIFPGKIVQYLACGKPVISTDLNGVRAVIGEGNGVLYTDFNNMASLTSWLLENKEEREFHSIYALEYAKQHDCSKVAEQLENILVSIK